MKNSTRILVATIVVAEVAVIAWLAIGVRENYEISQTTVANIINKDSIEYVEESGFDFFYDAKPNYMDVDGVPTMITTNADGLRERFDYKKEKPDSTLRIAAVGDSHTFGVRVAVEKIFPELLEDLLNENPICEGINHYEVINFGMHGYDAQFTAERFRLKGSLYDPDVVLWYILSNDFDENKNELERRLSEDGVGDRVTAEIIRSYEKQIKEEDPDALEAYQLEAVKKLAEKHTGPLLLFSGENYLKTETARKIRVLGGENVYFDLLFSLLPDELIIPNDYHPNEEGHQFLAKRLHEFLKAKEGIICQI